MSEQKAAAARALKLNRDYQLFLQDQLNRIAGSQRQNKELQQRVKKAINSSRVRKHKVTSRGVKQVKKPGTGYFVAKNGSRPPPNSDALELQLRGVTEKMPLVYPRFKWKPADDEVLTKAVQQHLQIMQMDSCNDLVCVWCFVPCF